MDPVTLALIGAGISGGSSLLGSFMNTSSAQAINSQNLQWSMANNPAANPQYFNNLRADANNAGINPLAALGVASGPGFSAQMFNPGSGVASGGASVGKILASIDPYVTEKKDLDVERTRVDIANARAAGNNTAQQIARDAMINEQMARFIKDHPNAIPPGFGVPSLGEMGASAASRILDASSYKNFKPFDAIPYNPSAAGYYNTP